VEYCTDPPWPWFPQVISVSGQPDLWKAKDDGKTIEGKFEGLWNLQTMTCEWHFEAKPDP
jgi:hypothetical protein